MSENLFLLHIQILVNLAVKDHDLSFPHAKPNVAQHIRIVVDSELHLATHPALNLQSKLKSYANV